MAEVLSRRREELNTAPAPQGAPCPFCGAPVDAGDRFCNGCGHEQPVAAAAVRPPEPQKFFRCQNCGAEVALSADERSYVCAFCDSKYVVDFSPAESARQTPEFVIGFAIEPRDAAERFGAWLGQNAWFRPGDLSTARLVGKLRGVYLPFWSFTMLAQSAWQAEIGEHWYRRETYTTTVNGKRVTRTRTVTETEWWPLAGRFHAYYAGYLVPASRGLGDRDAQRIQPFRIEAIKRYEPYFLAGWLSEEYSVPRDEALSVCHQEFQRRVHADVARLMPGDKHRELRVATEFSQVGSDLILLPLYLASYRYKDKLYRFLLNGQTGQIAGDKPVSWQRIGAAVGGAIAAVLLLWLLWWLFVGG